MKRVCLLILGVLLSNCSYAPLTLTPIPTSNIVQPTATPNLPTTPNQPAPNVVQPTATPNPPTLTLMLPTAHPTLTPAPALSTTSTLTPAPRTPIAIRSKGHIAFTRITYDSSPHGRTCHIFVMKQDGSESVDLTPESKGCFDHPTYSPDGNWIAFLDLPFYPSALMIMSSDGSGLRKIADYAISTYYGQIFWSRDSQRIALYQPCDRYKVCYRVFGIDGKDFGKIEELAPHDWKIPNFSPDGKSVAYRCQYIPHKPPRGICVATVQSTDETDLPPIYYPEDLSWSPDGKQIVYSSKLGLVVMNADRTNLRNLGQGQSPSWQP